MARVIENPAAGRERNSYVWRMHAGTHMYCKTNGLGVVRSVLGVVSPAEDAYITCLFNDFSTFATHETLAGAKLVVESVVALED